MSKDELVYSVDLEYDKAGFTSLNASIEQAVKAFAVVTGVVAAASAAIFSMAKGYAESSDELLKTSQRVNATTQEIQKLTFAAQDNGASMSDVTSSLESLAKAKENMLRGSGDFEAWGRLGVNPTEYANTADMLGDIADRVKDMDSQQAIDLMGRVGISSNMLQTLQQGKEGLNALGMEAESLGMISTDRMIKSSQDFMSGWNKASSSVKGVLDQVSASVLESTINPAIKAFNAFMSKNMKQITKILSTIIDYLVKASETIFAVFHTVYIQFERLANMMGGFEELIKAIGVIFVALKANMIMAMLPAILMAGALYLAFDEIMSFLEGKESFIGDFFDGIGVGAEEAREFIKQIGNPIERMIDLIKLSIDGWKNLFTGIGLGIDIVISKWESLVKWIQDTIKMFTDLGDTIKNALDFDMPELPSMGEIGGNIVSGASSLWDDASNLFSGNNTAQATAQTTNNNQISISVDGSGDPIAVGEEVKRVLNEEMNKSAQRGGF